MAWTFSYPWLFCSCCFITAIESLRCIASTFFILPPFLTFLCMYKMYYDYILHPMILYHSLSFLFKPLFFPIRITQDTPLNKLALFVLVPINRKQLLRKGLTLSLLFMMEWQRAKFYAVIHWHCAFLWPCHIWVSVFHDTPLVFKFFLVPLLDILLPLEILTKLSPLGLNAQQSFSKPWWIMVSTLNFSICKRVLLFPRMKMTLSFGV